MLKDPWIPVERLRRSMVPAQLRAWLFDGGSLTRRVVGACSGRFRVEVVDQRHARPLREEALALNLAPGQCALIRQVFLLCDETPWVFARSVIPLMTLRRARTHLGPLDSRPLGEVLFTDPTTVRGNVDVARLTAGHPVHAAAGAGIDTVLHGRRSVFNIRGNALLVAEIFLPDLPPAAA